MRDEATASADQNPSRDQAVAGLGPAGSAAGLENSITAFSSKVGVADATARQQQRIRFLRLGDEQHRRVAEKLRSCDKGHRCKSEADPVCVTLFHRKLCRALKPLLADRSWTLASIIPSGLLVPYGRLHEFDLADAAERLRRRFEQSSLCNRIIIGTINLSLVLKESAIVGWQMQLMLLIEGKSAEQLQKAARKAFPFEPKSANPYTLKNVRDPCKALDHIYTAKVHRRAQCRLKRQAHVVKLPLTGPDLKELLSFLARYPVGTRHLLNGVDRSGRLLKQSRDNEEK